MRVAAARDIASKVVWAVIIVTVVAGTTLIRWYGRRDFWNAVVDPDQPIWCPLAGLAVYGSSLAVLTFTPTEDEARSRLFMWSFGFCLVATLTCFAILLNRLLHLL